MPPSTSYPGTETVPRELRRAAWFSTLPGPNWLTKTAPRQYHSGAEVMKGQNAPGILPTATGKSVCHPVPALTKSDMTGAEAHRALRGRDGRQAQGMARALVHHLGCLIRVRRVAPRGIVFALCNRHAANIRIPFQARIGVKVGRVTVFTRHALVLRPFGQALAVRRSKLAISTPIPCGSPPYRMAKDCPSRRPGCRAASLASSAVCPICRRSGALDEGKGKWLILNGKGPLAGRTAGVW